MEVGKKIKLVLDLVANKKCRESFCENYLDENPILSPMIIDYWNLQRIKYKYITKTRMYDENSYSKKKIKEEEMIFLRKSFLFQPLRFAFEQQWLVTQELFAKPTKFCNEEKDYQFYVQSILFKDKRFEVNDSMKLYIKKNDKIQFDLMWQILLIPNVREKIINEYANTMNELVIHVIDNFNLKNCHDKYVKGISFASESSYRKNKIKHEEVFLIKKVFQYSLWLNHVLKYEAIKNVVLDDFLIENEPKSYNDNIKFLKKLTTSVLDEFFSNRLHIDDDITL